MEKTKKRIRVSDVITEKDINKWKNGDIVTISAGCGAGKSYFIKNVLYARAKAEGKKILMLVHRTRCSTQFELEIRADKKTDVIDIKTYQSIEFSLLNCKDISFSAYSYIVSDEFHYFIEDSDFNCYTDLSFDIIINYQNAVKIFMSATGDTMLDMMNKFVKRKQELYTYTIPPDYTHFRSLHFFYQQDTVTALAYRLKKANKKTIFFIQSVDDAYELYSKFKDCALFLCGINSSSGKRHINDIDEEKIEQMLVNQRFDELFLITTTCFDAGANIIDAELHTVVADVKNYSSLIQCLGRKRSQDVNDTLDIFIKAVSNKQLGGMRSKRIEGLKRADFLLQYGTRKYVEKYPRDDNLNKWHNALIYDEPMSKRNKNTCTKKVNQMMYEKYKLDIKLCDEMKRIGYPQYIAHSLQFGNGFGRYYNFYEEGQLNDYLEMLVENKNVMLTAEDKKQLIEIMNVKHNGKLLKSCNSLNAALKEKKYKYRIQEEDVYINKKRYRHAWNIVRVE